MDRYIVLPTPPTGVLNKSTQMDTFVAKARDAQATKMGVVCYRAT